MEAYWRGGRNINLGGSHRAHLHGLILAVTGLFIYYAIMAYRAGHEKLVLARISPNMRQTKKLRAIYEIPNKILHPRVHFQGVFITDRYYIQ